MSGVNAQKELQNVSVLTTTKRNKVLNLKNLKHKIRSHYKIH